MQYQREKVIDYSRAEKFNGFKAKNFEICFLIAATKN